MVDSKQYRQWSKKMKNALDKMGGMYASLAGTFVLRLAPKKMPDGPAELEDVIWLVFPATVGTVFVLGVSRRSLVRPSLASPRRTPASCPSVARASCGRSGPNLSGGHNEGG